MVVSGRLSCKQNKHNMEMNVKHISSVLLLTCLGLARTRQLGLYEGDACGLPNGEVGFCKIQTSCPISNTNLKQGIQPVICSFHGLNQLVVCCPQVVAPSVGDRFHESLVQLSPNEKVKIMCERYATFASDPSEDQGPAGPVSTRVGPSEHQPHGSKQRDESTTSDPRREVEIRIVGGETAGGNEFPHMAALGFGEENDIQWLCGGSLISERFVLTAAHCLQARGRGVVRWVRLGASTANDTSSAHAQKVAVTARHRHVNYTMTSYYHDIALLELEHEVRLSGFVHPACLHTDFVGPEDGGCIATGWGAVNTSVGESLELMKVELPFQEIELCNSTYRTLIRTRKLSAGLMEDTMICVGDLEKERDTCQGDSGGPIQVPITSPPNMYSIVGVTSFGMMGCGQARSPAVYTRVSHYIPWITNIVWPAT